MATEQDKRRTGERERRTQEDAPSAAQGIKIAGQEVESSMAQTDVKPSSDYEAGAHNTVGEDMRRSREDAIEQQSKRTQD